MTYYLLTIGQDSQFALRAFDVEQDRNEAYMQPTTDDTIEHAVCLDANDRGDLSLVDGETEPMVWAVVHTPSKMSPVGGGITKVVATFATEQDADEYLQEARTPYVMRRVRWSAITMHGDGLWLPIPTKSDLLREHARRENLPMQHIALSAYDPADFKGMPSVQP